MTSTAAGLPGIATVVMMVPEKAAGHPVVRPGVGWVLTARHWI